MLGVDVWCEMVGVVHGREGSRLGLGDATQAYGNDCEGEGAWSHPIGLDGWRVEQSRADSDKFGRSIFWLASTCTPRHIIAWSKVGTVEGGKEGSADTWRNKGMAMTLWHVVALSSIPSVSIRLVGRPPMSYV